MQKDDVKKTPTPSPSPESGGGGTETPPPSPLPVHEEGETPPPTPPRTQGGESDKLFESNKRLKAANAELERKLENASSNLQSERITAGKLETQIRDLQAENAALESELDMARMEARAWGEKYRNALDPKPDVRFEADCSADLFAAMTQSGYEARHIQVVPRLGVGRRGETSVMWSVLFVRAGETPTPSPSPESGGGGHETFADPTLTLPVDGEGTDSTPPTPPAARRREWLNDLIRDGAPKTRALHEIAPGLFCEDDPDVEFTKARLNTEAVQTSAQMIFREIQRRRDANTVPGHATQITIPGGTA